MSRYAYLAACALAAIMLVWVISRFMSRLSSRELSVRAFERGILVTLLLWGFVVVYGSFLIEGAYFAYRDTGLDTVDLYVPFYLNLIDAVRDGTLGAWNFQYGLGASALSYQSWLLDPFNIVLVPLGLLLGDANISVALAVTQGVKIVLAGVVFDSLLTRYCETPLARIIGSLCYAFSGFLMLWGQHYWIGAASVLFPLVLILLERLRESWNASRFVSVAAVVAVCLGSSPYTGFMTLLCAAVYMLLRLVHFADEGHILRSVVLGTARLLIPVLCGCLVACVTLVPYATYLFGETARLSTPEETSLLVRAAGYASEFVPLRWIPAIVSRFLGDGLITSGGSYPAGLIPSTGSFPNVNCYEFVSLGFGALSVVLLAQFAHWAFRGASPRDRALICVGAALVSLYCVNSFLPALLNIFSAPRFRSSFVLAIPVCLAMSVGWERRVQTREVARIPLLVGAAVTLATIAWSAQNTVDGRALCLAYAAVVVVGCLLLLTLRSARNISLVLLALCSTVFLGTLSDAFFVTNNRLVCTKEDFPAANQEVDANTRAALSWVASQDKSFYRVEKTYSNWCMYNDSLIQGYRGVNGYNSTGDGDILSYFKVFWPEAMGTAGFTQYYPASSNPIALLDDLGVRYLLSRDEQPEPYELVATFGNVLVYRNEGASILRGGGPAIPESSVLSIESVAERRQILGNGVVVPDEKLESLSALGEGAVETSSSLEPEGTITGTVSTEGSAIIRLSVPYSQGWVLTVDGERVDTFRVDFGFVGFVVGEGVHSIEASYEVPGLALGVVLASVGLATGVVVAGAKTWCQSRTGTSSPSDTRR